MIYKEDIIKTLKYLEVCYVNNKLTDEERIIRVQIWYSKFKDVNKEEFTSAVNKHIDNSSFFPTIADINKIMHQSDDLNALTSFNTVLKLISLYGHKNSLEINNELNKIEKDVLKKIGLKNIALCDEKTLSFLKKDFINEFNEVLNNASLKERKNLLAITVVNLKELPFSEDISEDISDDISDDIRAMIFESFDKENKERYLERIKESEEDREKREKREILERIKRNIKKEEMKMF